MCHGRLGRSVADRNGDEDRIGESRAEEAGAPERPAIELQIRFWRPACVSAIKCCQR